MTLRGMFYSIKIFSSYLNTIMLCCERMFSNIKSYSNIAGAINFIFQLLW